MEIFSQLPDLFALVISLPKWALLLFFCLSNFLENIFPPWPGDSFTVFSGFLLSQGKANFSFYELALATLFGNWVGALLMFFFGKHMIHFLRETPISWIRNLYQEDSFQKTMDWFRRYSGFLILFSRFSAGIRFFVAIVAGMSKMNVIRFLFYYSIAVTIWCGLLIFGGFQLGKNWDQVLIKLSIYNKFVSVFIFLLVLATSYFYFKRRNEAS